MTDTTEKVRYLDRYDVGGDGYGDDPAVVLVEARRRLHGVNPLVWRDIGPHLTCVEAEAFVMLLVTIGFEREAELLAEGHARSDYEEEDLHGNDEQGQR